MNPTRRSRNHIGLVVLSMGKSQAMSASFPLTLTLSLGEREQPALAR
jgi:hypothetical protein